jgi:hypothetical protein
VERSNSKIDGNTDFHPILISVEEFKDISGEKFIEIKRWFFEKIWEDGILKEYFPLKVEYRTDMVTPA